MFFRSSQPSNDLLRRFIAYYYLDGSDDEAYRNSYIYYPHVNTTVSVYKNAICEADETNSRISYCNDVKFIKLITNQTLPRRSIQVGKTNKLAIVFKPLGLNRFIQEKYSDIIRGEYQVFEPQNYLQWDEMLEDFFNRKEDIEKFKILDNFFLGQYNGYENPVLEEAIAMLSDTEIELSIEEIACSLQISRRTLLRHFKSELRITPELFRMIVRFRSAIAKKILNSSPKTMTEIAYEVNFFDQSYFNQRFKQLTGLTPTQFFKSGRRLGQEDTFWIFDTSDS